MAPVRNFFGCGKLALRNSFCSACLGMLKACPQGPMKAVVVGRTLPNTEQHPGRTDWWYPKETDNRDQPRGWYKIEEWLAKRRATLTWYRLQLRETQGLTTLGLSIPLFLALLGLPRVRFSEQSPCSSSALLKFREPQKPSQNHNYHKPRQLHASHKDLAASPFCSLCLWHH